jgi:hypothetical protein
MEMPIHVSMRDATSAKEAARLYLYVQDTLPRCTYICVSCVSDKLLRSKEVLAKEICHILNGLLITNEGPRNDMGTPEPKLSLDGRSHILVASVDPSRLNLTRTCTKRVGPTRPPISGERGRSTSLLNIQIPYIVQGLSDDQAEAVNANNLAFIVRGVPESSSAMEACRRTLTRFANDALTMPTLVLISKVTHITPGLDGTRRTSQETVALILLVGRLRQDSITVARSRAGVVKGKFRELKYQGWYLELACDMEDVQNKGIGGYLAQPQNIIKISGLASCSLVAIAEGLARDSNAQSIAGWYRAADMAAITVMLDGHAQINVLELERFLGCLLHPLAASGHFPLDSVPIYAKEYRTPRNLLRPQAAATAQGTGWSAAAGAGGKVTKTKVASGIWMNTPIGVVSSNNTSTRSVESSDRKKENNGSTSGDPAKVAPASLSSPPGNASLNNFGALAMDDDAWTESDDLEHEERAHTDAVDSTPSTLSAGGQSVGKKDPLITAYMVSAIGNGVQDTLKYSHRHTQPAQGRQGRQGRGDYGNSHSHPYIKRPQGSTSCATDV